MGTKEIEVSIGAYRSRLENAKHDATYAIADGQWLLAASKLLDCAAFDKAIEELEFQLELAEIDGE